MLSWDIAKLAGPIKGKYFDAYAMIDIYSRYIVGAHVHVSESAVLATEMMREIFAIHGVPHVVHADRGTSMTSKTVAVQRCRPRRNAAAHDLAEKASQWDRLPVG